MKRAPVPNPMKSPEAVIPTASEAFFLGNHRSICGARATSIQARPIPAMRLLRISVGKLPRRKGRRANPIIMKKAPMDVEILGPFLSISEPAGHARNITDIPMRERRRLDCHAWMLNRVSKFPSMGARANQFDPKANITNQNAATMAQRYL